MVLRWIFGLLFAVLGAYILFVLLNTYIQEQKKPKTFRCEYISGMCTKKPTWKNCRMYGEIPVHLCEERLNIKEKKQ